jgi:anti-sigma regulatory factor (Ser/Thr protein kinase)
VASKYNWKITTATRLNYSSQPHNPGFAGKGNGGYPHMNERLPRWHSTSDCRLAPTVRGKDENAGFESDRASACTDRFNGAGPDFADGHRRLLAGEVGVSGESYVAEEINEHFSPKVNGRFVRITRGDGSVMYLSDEPESKMFDPSRAPPLKAQADRESLREEHLTADSELMIFAMPFTAAEDKDIALQCEAERQVRVEGDRARLKQVIVNLVDNAIKYTPAGGLVGVKVMASNGRAVIEVNDSGVGIPPEALPHIFERYYRVDKARSRQMGGAGLGLSIIKAIVTAHGGQVKVESVEGKGSQFLVEPPIAGKTSE